MFIEGIIAMTLFFGGLIGYTASQNIEPEKTTQQRPMDWQPKEHRDGMLMCKASCDNKMGSYSALTAQCTCIGNKS